MRVSTQQVCSYRLCAHHLDERIPAREILRAASICGLQNTPPGAWETALYNRLEGCTLDLLHNALYDEKILLQAWSCRGVPVVFPTEESAVFLTSLIAEKGEQPWIYTRGITAALDFLNMSFEEALTRTKDAVRFLDNHTIKSKETLDQTIAALVEEDLSKEARTLWQSPSMYDNLGKQTVGEATVSFLLRPCSFHSLVVFGKRQDSSPTFTSFENWTGHAPLPIDDAGKELVRKFLHCFGPATIDYFSNWLGSSKQQAKRLWNTISGEMSPVELEGKTHYLLSSEIERLVASRTNKRILLLGAHDPYLDLRDRALILESKAHQKTVWQFVSNPGAVLMDGRVIGVWKTKTLRGALDIAITLWKDISSADQKTVKQLAEGYAAFRLLGIRTCSLEYV